MHDEELFEKVRAALGEFLAADQDLLRLDASERSITHKLAEHLQRQFPEHSVDCEYNRAGDEKKKLYYPKDEDTTIYEFEAKTIFPDIIVHRRRINVDNELVIEVKKGTTGRVAGRDEYKLQKLTDKGGDFCYKVGLFLEFDTSPARVHTVVCFHGDGPEHDTIWKELVGLGHDD